MSSSLNLSPDFTVIGVQAALFVANMFVVKKLMLEPYLKVRFAREQKTGGSQGDAQKLIQEAKDLDHIISLKLKEAHKSASETRDVIKADAQKILNRVIQEAEQTSKKEQLALQQGIAANLQEEKSKREETIARITDEMVKIATN